MILTIFAIYLLGMLAVGFYFWRYNKSIGDFVLGGRRLGPWVAAFSAQASDFSAWLLIGLPSAAYLNGLSAMWACIGCLAGVIFNWVVLAPPLRRLTEQYGSLTVPDFLESRFNDTRHVIRVLTVLVILIYYVSYIAAQFDAAGSVFATAFGATQPDGVWPTYELFNIDLTPRRQGLLIGATVILAYTAIGGFLAVSWTDFVQATLMVGAVVLLPIVALVHAGGFAEFWERIAEGQHGTAMLLITRGDPWPSFLFGVVIAGLSWGMGYPGQPHIVARFMAIQDPRKIPKSALISAVWSFFALYGSLAVGLSALAILGPVLKEMDADRAMPLLAVELLPSILAGLILSAAVAAMMSTVDSQLIVAVSAVVRDIYECLLGGKTADRTAVWLSRIVMVAFGVVGVSMVWRDKSVFETIFDAWGGLAAGIGPPLVLGCVWKRTSRVGVIVGMAAGVLLFQFWAPLMHLIDQLAASRDQLEAAKGKKLVSELARNIEATKLVTTVFVNVVIITVFSLIRPGQTGPITARAIDPGGG